MKKHAFLYVVMIMLFLTVLETLSFFATAFLESKNIFYRPTINSQYAEYLARRDSVLGWPAPNEFDENDLYDPSGSRVIPAFPDPAQPACISLYGDSFTWSSEVDSQAAWSNVLAEFTGCRVANYGVGGYGSDQAFLRFKTNVNDSAKIVFLNHLSENIVRNVNRYRDLLYRGAGLGFKPRFIIGEDEQLQLLPLPEISPQDYPKFAVKPEAFLSAEYFFPGGEAGISKAGFPYSFSLLRGFRHYMVRARLDGEPWYMPFYQPEHPARGLQTTTAILEAFHAEAISRGKKPIITIIPTGHDLQYYLKHDAWPYQNLINNLRSGNIPAFNFGEGIFRKIGDRDPCELFNDCSAHYNEKGYRLLAELAYELLQERRLTDVWKK